MWPNCRSTQEAEDVFGDYRVLVIEAQAREARLVQRAPDDSRGPANPIMWAQPNVITVARLAGRCAAKPGPDRAGCARMMR